MPQMSPLLWMVYPYVMVLVMMVFLTTLIKEGIEMEGEEGFEVQTVVRVSW